MDEQKHPSHGVISISRRQGHQRLFRSPVIAHSYIAITISEAEIHGTERDGEGVARDGKRIIEISMSASQFADMITSPNSGVVPCTISRRDGAAVPPPDPEPDTLTARAQHASSVIFRESVGALDEAIAAVKSKISEATTGPKRKAMEAILSKIDRAKCRITSDAAFYTEHLAEHAMGLRAKVSAEVVATADVMLRQMGLEAMRERAAKVLPSLTFETND